MIQEILNETDIRFNFSGEYFEVPYNLLKRDKEYGGVEYYTFGPRYIPKYIREIYRVNQLFERLVDKKKKDLSQKIKEELSLIKENI